jgi:hypothetical protein
VEAGGARPASGAGGGSESIVESEQVSMGRDHTGPARHPSRSGDDDVMSRGKE